MGRLKRSLWTVLELPFRLSKYDKASLKKINNSFTLNKPTWALLCFVITFTIILVGLNEDYESAEVMRNGFPPDVYFNSLQKVHTTQNFYTNRQTITLAFVVCATRFTEAITMLKTVIFFSQKAHINLHFVAVVDLTNEEVLAKKLAALSKDADEALDIKLNYEIHRVWLPQTNRRFMYDWFAPCSSQRLFFPISLPHIDSLIYFDTDVLVLSNITEIWNEFDKMKPGTLGAVAAEHELPGDGWYNLHSLIPYYGPRGLNTGTMLMNLTAMRNVNFQERIEAIFQEYGSRIKWADQDILNILFKYDPQFLHEFSCAFNYRVQHCFCDHPGTGDCGCKAAEQNGISVFHGNRGAFHRTSFIKNIYESFKKYNLREGSPEKLLQEMKSDYYNLPQSERCTSAKALFSKFEKFNLNLAKQS